MNRAAEKALEKCLLCSLASVHLEVPTTYDCMRVLTFSKGDWTGQHVCPRRLAIVPYPSYHRNGCCRSRCPELSEVLEVVDLCVVVHDSTWSMHTEVVLLG